MIRVEGLAVASAPCRRSTASGSRRGTGASRACSARTAPASPRRCASSTRCCGPTPAAPVDGVDVVADPLDARRRIGVLPHGAGIYPQLTARENIAYFGRLHGLEGAALERADRGAARRARHGGIADRRAKGFSQGERIKVALARALVHAPKNLLLDEPTNGLDVMATRALRALVLRLRDAGHCVLFSSHVMQEVAALCDDIVIVDHGRVVAAGTPEELRARFGAATLEDAFVAAIGDARGLE